MFYAHVSDQYAPYHAKIVNVGGRDDLLYHASDLRIEEYYPDTAAFTDHVFALMHLLGFRFTPCVRDLGETKLAAGWWQTVAMATPFHPVKRPALFVLRLRAGKDQANAC